jgi:ribosomal protein S18 acetylase RimI-like enzyme
VVTIRSAQPADEAELVRIDLAAETTRSTIRPLTGEPRPFDFDGDVLVAEVDGALAGYVRLVHPTPFPSSAHVLYVNGLAVDPAVQRRGVGRALVEAAKDRARERGMRRLTLRVLAPNEAARALYAACGFVVEGVFRGEFHLDGEDVDDLFLAYRVT